jgi:asparagine N-glycosylation enzyme membrane subunit Stt3
MFTASLFLLRNAISVASSQLPGGQTKFFMLLSVSIGVLSAVVPTQMLEVLKFIKEKTISQKYHIGARDRVMQERLKEKLALLFIHSIVWKSFERDTQNASILA